MPSPAPLHFPQPTLVRAAPAGRWEVHRDWQPRAFRFGPFLLQPERQLLLDGDRPVRIGGRALDLLTALVERPGQVIGKDELIARAWPGIFVDEANLKVNIAALRRVLAERADVPRYVATVIGRGYRFIAPVGTCDPAAVSDR